MLTVPIVGATVTTTRTGFAVDPSIRWRVLQIERMVTGYGARNIYWLQELDDSDKLTGNPLPHIGEEGLLVVEAGG